MARQYRHFRMREVARHLGQIGKLLQAPDWTIENLDNLSKWSDELAARCKKAREDAIEAFKKEAEKNGEEKPNQVRA